MCSGEQLLRINFLPSDWERLRIVTKPDPMWEILLSLYMLGEASDEQVFGQWRRRVFSRITPETRMLLDLVPPQGYSPDFLSPLVGGRDPEDGIAAVLNTPRQRIVEDLDRRFGGRPCPPWTAGLARKDAITMRALGRLIRTYFNTAVRPYWGYISQVAADRAASIRNTAPPPIAEIVRLKDRPPRRRVTVELSYNCDQELHLGGRGLTLIPAFFCVNHPLTYRDSSLPPALLYPVGHEPISFLLRAARGSGPAEDVLRRLLGSTRGSR
jgi:hypothetical protein